MGISASTLISLLVWGNEFCLPIMVGQGWSSYLLTESAELSSSGATLFRAKETLSREGRRVVVSIIGTLH